MTQWVWYGWGEGGSEQIGCSVRDCKKKPCHTLVEINARDDPFISCESSQVSVLGLYRAKELSSQQHQTGKQSQSSKKGLVKDNGCSLWISSAKTFTPSVVQEKLGQRGVNPPQDAILPPYSMSTFTLQTLMFNSDFLVRFDLLLL